MGVVISQSIRSTFSYYFGMMIGAINTVILYPLVFDSNPEYLGLIQILIAYSIICSTFTNLSTPSIFIRYFPFVKNKGQLFLFSMLLFCIGFIIFCCCFYFFSDGFIANINSSMLLVDYAYLIVPLVFFISFSDILNSFSRSFLDASTPIFLNEVFLKIYSLIILISYWQGYIEFDLFLKIYFFGYLLKSLILFLV